jgi:hypothetical protein
VAKRLNHPFCSETSSSSDIVVARAHKSPARSARSPSLTAVAPQISDRVIHGREMFAETSD